MPDIKNFKSKHNCLSSGQVLCHGYSFEDGKLIDSYTEAVTLNSGVNTLEKPIPAYSADRTVNVFMWDLLAKPYRFAQISE